MSWVERVGICKGAMTLGVVACHPELVEGRAQRPTPLCFDRLSMTPFFNCVIIKNEGSSSPRITALHSEEDSSLSLRMTDVLASILVNSHLSL